MRKPRRNSGQETVAESAGWRGWDFIAPTCIILAASLLLLWGLSNRYLWQDEANTAVLGMRMLRFGRPLAYDGLNLVTIDSSVAEDARTVDQRTTGPQAAIAFYVNRGDFKPDTAWRFHPWGQFIIAAASIKLLGRTTLAARLPFALAGIVTVLLLYLWIRASFDSPLVAPVATVLLLFNAYWILHSRQCRYYSFSSLFLVLTLIAYSRWQRGESWGASAFVLATWVWFQVDYGTLWPVLGVLFVDAFVSDWRKFWKPGLVGIWLMLTLAPFIYYYGLWHRLSGQELKWKKLFSLTLFNINEYVVPIPIVLAAVAFLVWRWKTIRPTERRLLAVACGMIGALAIWVPSVAPGPFLRYVIIAAPVGCLASAWILSQLGKLHAVYAWLGASVLILTPWLSMPLHAVTPAPDWYGGNGVFREELARLRRELLAPPPDPNRIVIDWLRKNADPADEILINYEDLPLMYYLPNPVRGGIAAFRAEDDTNGAPTFLVMRQSVGFVHWPVFQREVNRYQWIQEPVIAPDVPWGNNPDPMAQIQDVATRQNIIVARRVGSTERTALK